MRGHSRRPASAPDSIEGISLARVEEAMRDYGAHGVEHVSVRQVLDLCDPNGSWRYSFSPPVPEPPPAPDPRADPVTGCMPVTADGGRA